MTDSIELFPWVFSFVIGAIFGAFVVALVWILNTGASQNLMCEVLR